ncbi:hypothetical protein AVEN_142753-1, partial [Araneus ventricosus]
DPRRRSPLDSNLGSAQAIPKVHHGQSTVQDIVA